MQFLLCTVSSSMAVLFFILFCQRIVLLIELLMKLLPIVQKSIHPIVINGIVHEATSPPFRAAWG